ncbi:MAG: MBG domain-containing protein [Bacteroidales bacterium]|nr:MBG domain-containing protein [Bacteroidales bacterium]
MKSTRIFPIIIALVLFSLGSYAQNWDQIVKSCATDRNAQDYYGRSLAIDGNFAIVGAWGQDKDASGGGSTLSEAGAAYILQNINDTWVEIQKIVALDRGTGDNFGYSVDINGDYAVIGAWKENHDAAGTNSISDAGSAYVFYNNAGTWEQSQKIVASDRAEDDYFGQSVAIDGDFIVVGAFNEDDDENGNNALTSAGSIYVFKNNGTNWTETQKIVPSDRAAADFFGNSVDICGNYIIAGAYNKHDVGTNSAGAAYVFYHNGTTWSQISKLLAFTLQEQAFFGFDVAINENFAVVGAYGENETLSSVGATHIYTNPGAGANLPYHSKITASDGQENDRFGYSVDIDGNYIIVGADLEDHDENGLNELTSAGSAYIYNYNGSIWAQEQKIVHNDRNPADFFGCDVAISNNYIIAGAMNQDTDAAGINNRPEAGAAYVFHNCREINIYQEATQIDNEGTFDFGSVLYGNSSAELTFTIENTGVDNLTLDGTPVVEISGANAADFSINQTAINSIVTPGSSTTFTIIFSASSIGLHTANISIANNDYDENPYLFTITGTGLKLPQSISDFTSISTKTYGDEDFLISATASSGLDVVFTSSDENIAICGGINGSNITIVGAGSCEIYANQPGNEIYLPAPQISQTLTVNKKSITVTADPNQTKEYGDSDPELTYTVSAEGLETGDSFSGALTRIAGETVSVYEILIGSLSAGTNYNIAFVSNDFEITKRTIYVTANDDQSKIYGETDPVLTYSYTPALVGGDAFTGSISRLIGEDAGYYEIQQNTLSLNSNYTIDYTSNMFEIVAKTITVTPNSGQSKIYGTTDPVAFVYSTSPSLVSGDTYTGALSRDAGEDAGFYTITVGSLSAGDNYIMSVVDVDFEIVAKSISVNVISNQSKSYGDNDPVFNYQSIPAPLTGDEFTGELSRESGEDLGLYAITQGTLSLGSNYNLSFNSADFEIIVKSLMIIVDSDQTKEYGDIDPEFTFTTTSPIAPWDSFTGALAREDGEFVGEYAINQGSLALNSNYSTFFMGADFEITQKTITVTADANQTKYYGEVNPTYTYTYSGTLASGDDFQGALTRESGESVGTYNILQGGLWISSNYIIVFNSNVFEILQGEISVTANAGQSKVYGSADPTQYTYEYTGTLAIGDSFTGNLSRLVGEDVGSYEIQQGSLSLSNNYNITYYPNNFAITTKPITVTADANQTKVFGEDDPAAFTYTVSGTLVGEDSFTGELSRESGENVGLYQILQGDLSLSSNYDITYVYDNFEISPKPITVTADADQTKVFGEDDPATFTYTVSGTILGEDAFTGELSREAGENVGLYQILLGNLSLGSNYDIIFNAADFEITKATPIITWENPADIYVGTELSATQLNASANIAGSFNYNPAVGTILEVGDNQALNVEFTPIDVLNYTNENATVYINVLLNIGVDKYCSGFEVYPNPAKDFVNILQKNTLFDYLTVYDITGKIVMQQSLNNLTTSLDISNLKSGIYFIALASVDFAKEKRIKLVKTDN